jgi:transmembrane sensor
MKSVDPGTLALNDAIAWAVRLSSGTANDDDQRAFSQWQRASDVHRRAWERVEQQLQSFEVVRERGGEAARKALCVESPTRRRVLQSSLGAFLTVGLAGYLWRYTTAGNILTADIKTDVGRRADIKLADGSGLSLDAHSAVDVNFTAQKRAITLLRGQLFIQVAHDPSRPLVVSTRDGTATALGTAFGVSLLDGGTRVAVTESKVNVRPDAGQGLVLNPGDVAMLQAGGVRLLSGVQADAELTWRKGYITAVERPLGEIVDTLRAYLPGFIFVSQDAAALRVSGLFLLDDINGTIRQIAQTLPVSVTYHTDYLIQISAR